MFSFVAVAAVLLTCTDSSSALSVPQLHHQLASSRLSSPVICNYANDPFDDDRPQDVIKQRRVPRRAMPHIQTASRAEEATRAGYIIRQDHSVVEVSERKSDGNGRRVRPLRIIRRIVLRRGRRDDTNSMDTIQSEQRTPLEELEFHDDELTEEVTIELSYGSNRKSKVPNVADMQSSMLKSAKKSSRRASKPNISNRVTFKSTRGASRSIPSSCPTLSSAATLTEYMTQPVEQYSLLSFHDEEPVKKNMRSGSKRSGTNSLKARRWLVRRLTAEESKRYVESNGRGSKSNTPASADNLFRLAVPLLPLIGWDLTPVIDLEVIPPQVKSNTSNIESRSSKGQESSKVSCNSNEHDYDEVSSVGLNRMQKWAPLKGIRNRVGGNPDNVGSDNGQLVPVVKIRSLSVSLLSTQEEVHAAMLGKQPNSNKLQHHQSSKMQEEAIGMVGKVEEWLKPHITFEAELSWTDNGEGAGANKDDINPASSDSIVTVKSTAITSLTIPKLPSGPSAFLVTRLGSTLTSKALEICLPRFLRQLERDYYRWSGLDDASAKKESQ